MLKGCSMWGIALLICAPVFGQQTYEYALLLDGPGYERNVIHSLNTATGQVVPYSYRLRNALDALLGPGHGVVVESLSFGLDGTDYDHPHGVLAFSLADRADSTTNGGLPGTSVAAEHKSELHADIFIVPHERSLDAELNLKSVEENSAVLPPTSDQYFPTASFGLAGAFTGNPISLDPPDIVGVDYHLASAKGRIYFTVYDALGALNSNDILVLESDNSITVWQTAEDIGLVAGDRIDALSMCVNTALYRGQTPNAIFSLRAGSPSASGSYNGGELLHQIAGSPFTVWRSAAANGLDILHASGPGTGAGPIEITGVVSIDPLELRIDHKWGEAPGSPFEISPSTDEVINRTVTTTTTPVILWNFSVGGFDAQDRYVLNLEPGDEGLLTVYYLDDGQPASFQEWISEPEATPNLISNVDVYEQVDNSLVCLISYATPTMPNTQCEFCDNGVTSTYVLDPLASLLVVTLPRPLVPGRRVLEARTSVAGSGARSFPVRETIWQTGSLAAPTDLQIEKLGFQQVRISWNKGSSDPEESTRVVVTGAQTTYTYTGESPWTLTMTSSDCYYEVELVTQVEGSDGYSEALRGSFFDGVEQRAESFRTIPSTIDPANAIEAGDLAYWDSTDQLVYVSREDSSDWYTLDLSDHMDEAIPKTYSTGGYSFTGVTTITATIRTGDDVEDAETEQVLLFFGTSSSGAPTLIVIGEGGTILRTISVAFEKLPGSTGAVAYDPQSARILLTADGHLYEGYLGADILLATVLSVAPVESLRFANVNAVSCRANGYYDVPVFADLVSSKPTHLLTLDAADRVVGCLDLGSSVVYGVAHAHSPLSKVFIARTDCVEEHFCPLVVEPSDTNPFTTLGLPYDFDNDGVAATDEDWQLFGVVIQLYIAQDPAFATVWSGLNHAAWDVVGGGGSYPGDGQIDNDDYLTLYVNYGQVPQTSVCVPVNPAWYDKMNPACLQ